MYFILCSFVEWWKGSFGGLKTSKTKKKKQIHLQIIVKLCSTTKTALVWWWVCYRKNVSFLFAYSEIENDAHRLVRPPSNSHSLHCPSVHNSLHPSNFSHSPLVWIHCNGTRLAQLRVYQHFSLPAVCRGDRDALVAWVGPVNVLVDPVDGQALGGVERVDESHLLRRVTGLVDVSTGGW